MTPAEFIKRRRDDWVELERMIADTPVGRRLRSSPDGASRLAALFRSACSDLARARASGYPDDLIDYLNSLTARCHNLFYVAPPFPLRRVWEFFSTLFPLTVRRNAAYVVAGLLLFYGPMAGMIALSVYDDQVLYQIVPKHMLESVESMYKKGHAGGRGEDTDAMMTGFYVRNNVGIAFQCFAAGIFLGFGSIIVILFNGVFIGAIVGFVAQTPAGMNLLSFIVGHGPFELTAICLAGAAGLRLGFGVIITGNRSRTDSLRLAALDAVKIILGAATLLLGAALIEGFFSPSSLPMAVKFAFGGLCALFLVWYLGIRSVQVHRAQKRAEEEGRGVPAVERRRRPREATA
jgi:uncharacterized membrane protein SpoIIM required for sporulation